MTTTKTIFFVAALVIMIGFMAVPVTGHAQAAPPTNNNISVFPTGFWGPLLSCRGETCRTICDLVYTFQRIVYFALTLLIFVFTPFMILWGGGLIMLAGGSSEKVGQGKGKLTAAAIAVGIGLGAFLIVDRFYAIIAPQVTGQAHWYSFQCDASHLPSIFQPPSSTTP